MLSAVSKAGRAPAVLRHGRRVPVTSSQLRTLTATPQTGLFRTQTDFSGARLTQKRLFSAARANAAGVAQQAPDPKAYLASGVVKPKEYIDVKKVLVIGSGGLAIGQAGEFDYSGMSECHASAKPPTPQAVNTESHEPGSRNAEANRSHPFQEHRPSRPSRRPV